MGYRARSSNPEALCNPCASFRGRGHGGRWTTQVRGHPVGGHLPPGRTAVPRSTALSVPCGSVREYPPSERCDVIVRSAWRDFRTTRAPMASVGASEKLLRLRRRAVSPARARGLRDERSISGPGSSSSACRSVQAPQVPELSHAPRAWGRHRPARGGHRLLLPGGSGQGPDRRSSPTFPGVLGFHGEPLWWPLPWLALSGVLVAAAIRYLPGTGGSRAFRGLPGGRTRQPDRPVRHLRGRLCHAEPRGRPGARGSVDRHRQRSGSAGGAPAQEGCTSDGQRRHWRRRKLRRYRHPSRLAPGRRLLADGGHRSRRSRPWT